MYKYLFALLLLCFCFGCPDPEITPAIKALNVGDYGSFTDEYNNFWESDIPYLIGANIVDNIYYSVYGNPIVLASRKYLIGHDIPLNNGYYRIKLFFIKPHNIDDGIIEVRMEKELPTIIDTATIPNDQVSSISIPFVKVSDNMLNMRWLSNNPNTPTFLSGIEIFKDYSYDKDPYLLLEIDCTDSFNYFNTHCLSSDDPVNCLINYALNNDWENVCIPPGNHNVTHAILPTKSINIYGYGAILTYTARVPAVYMEYSASTTKIKLQGFTIDYNPLTFTQGKVIDFVYEGAGISDKREIIIELDDGYPNPLTQTSFHNADTYFVFEPNLNGHYSFSRQNSGFGFVTGFEVEGTYLKLLQPTAIDMQRMILNTDGTLKPNLKVVFEEPGDGLSTIDSIYLDGELEIKEVTFWNTVGMVVRHRGSRATNTYYKWISIEPGPIPETATEPRLLSANRDGFHAGVTRQGPIVLGAEAKFLGDDCANSSGLVYTIMSNNHINLTLSPNRKWPVLDFLYKPGDTLRILSSITREILQTVQITSVSPLYYVDGDMRYDITINEPLNSSIPDNSWADIPEHNSPNTLITYSIFGPNRANGIRANGNNSLIFNNLFIRNTDNGILSEPNYIFWRNAGWVNNSSYLKNQIIEPNINCIRINDEVINSKNMHGLTAHQNILIENNYLSGPKDYAIYINGLDIIGNIQNNQFVNIPISDIYIKGE